MVVSEDAEVGTRISGLQAEDKDEDSVLRFRIDYNRSEARAEDGRVIRTGDWQVGDKTTEFNYFSSDLLFYMAVLTQRKDTFTFSGYVC